MKTSQSKNIVLLSLLLLGLASCNLQETNINPNSPTEVPERVILPFAQESLARLMGSTPQVMAGIFMQYYRGVDNHPSQIEIYQVNEALYVDWDWNDYYDGPMVNIKNMNDVASENESYYYIGIGKTMMALCLGNISSMWGDVPWLEALQASENTSPKYDDQKFIYEEIQRLLDEAITAFKTDYEGYKPAADDIIFGGEIDKWLKTAYALKARYYMHLTKKAGELDFDPATEALKAIENAYEFDDENMIYQYGYNASEYHPFYSFSRLNYLLPDNFLTSTMLLTSDPRKDAYFQKVFGTSTLKEAYYTSPGSPVHMMTYYEMKFLEAEARLRIDISDPLIETALREAVLKNIVRINNDPNYGDDVISFIDNNCTLSGSYDDQLERIIKQKYIAMYASIESWTDYRRTGYPVLTPNDGGDHNQNPGGAIPRRLTYPQTERLYNTNFPKELPTLQDRFWWDQE